LIIEIVEGELIQVFINILNNAKDVLIEKQIDEKWIKIEISKKDELAIVTIEDNAGGIKKEILAKIFEPYFTTKHQSQGTGLGLHMSHKIISESCSGKLFVTNTQYGAKFTIEIPLQQNN
jgi:C4-dicarboxylate-specific signal transduction histidine kinase